MRRGRLAAVMIVAIVAAVPAFVARDASDAPRVVAIHPAAQRVPSNLLRLYVEFSVPMESDWARTHVTLLDDNGRAVDRAFLEMEDELWDPTYRRLTVLFDPGRVKRGIRSNLELGAPLTEGRRYRVVVNSGWRGADGVALATPFEQEIVVGAFDSVSPDPKRWAVSSPRAGTREAVVVRFDEPLDHALALRLIVVADTSGATIEGASELFVGDTMWRFTPVSAWRRGSPTLRVDAALEDLAGNSIARAFDRDVQHGGARAEVVRGGVTLPIVIRQP